ncbi:MAG: hypothetical protein O3A01_03395 [bacterium]|nr:hypothetical protein [bacterium]
MKSGQTGIAIRKGGVHHDLYKGAYYLGHNSNFSMAYFDNHQPVRVRDLVDILNSVCVNCNLLNSVPQADVPVETLPVQPQPVPVQPQQPRTHKRSLACVMQ